ncbi:hypothetical protein C1Y40_05297 [Mycobacterium talmoniae]|uniref:Uncharacterized protein n=1 Tax=Mycobacterium talmoniae TaxID=1858794 RepID=A0A2S8BD36_9MYCO|nr:hypothetical protein C1Y40_05297 [Mycobacterium talmoniae]
MPASRAAPVPAADTGCPAQPGGTDNPPTVDAWGDPGPHRSAGTGGRHRLRGTGQHRPVQAGQAPFGLGGLLGEVKKTATGQADQVGAGGGPVAQPDVGDVGGVAGSHRGAPAARDPDDVGQEPLNSVADRCRRLVGLLRAVIGDSVVSQGLHQLLVNCRRLVADRPIKGAVGAEQSRLQLRYRIGAGRGDRGGHAESGRVLCDQRFANTPKLARG